ncbi:MAG: urea ABC transporter permease subunit UrtB [Geminicoccaceae bacterium]
MIALLRLLVVLLLASATPALAQEIGGSLAKFTGGKFDDVEAGIQEIAGSGHPQAQAILQALSDGKLVFRQSDKAVFILGDGDAVIDPVTGTAATDVTAAGLKPVRVNNRVRRAIEAALGGLTLLSPDPTVRFEAAQSVLRSRDANALPTLDAALAKETEPSIARVLEQARAAIIIVKDDAAEPDRVAAVEILAARGDPEAAAMLRTLPDTVPESVRSAAERAVAKIERRLAFVGIAQNIAQGISLGSVLLLAAIGLAITFGVMGVINMAHGEMVMLGAYTTVVVQELIKAYAPGMLDASVVIALPAAFLIAGAVGVAIERGIIRFLYGRPLETLLATFGLSLILQQAVRSLFGPSNREVVTPSWMSGTLEVMPGFDLTWNRIVIVIFACTVFAALLLAMRRTPLGLQMRAVTQNRRMAGSMGIRTPLVDALTFGLGSGIAGIAGVALAQIDNVSPNLGQGYIIDSFMVVVFGGVGNLWGTLTGALTLGILNKFLEPLAGAVLAKILVLAGLIIFIQRRPRGLFALRGRAVES